MFTHYSQKKSKTQPAVTLTDLTPFKSSEILLEDERRQRLMTEIKNTCGFDLSSFNALHAVLIGSFVNHVQLLPETANSYYAEPGGILDHALNRTEAAMSLFRQFVVFDTQEQYSEEQKLWAFALFSAALLQGIGKLYVDFTIKRHDKSGKVLAQWNPLLDAMNAEGVGYTFTFEKEKELDFRRRLNLLIAKLLMPLDGFAWIASNSGVLAVWLALLNEDYARAGTLGALLIRADAIALRRYFQSCLGQGRNHLPGRKTSMPFAAGVPVSVDELSNKAGMEFLQWLSEALEAGTLAFNQPPLAISRGGVVLTSEIFKMFLKQSPLYKTWIAVQNGLLSLGLHEMGPDGQVEFRVENETGNTAIEGIILENFAIILPDQVQFFQADQAATMQLSAVEFIHQVQGNQRIISQQTLQNSLLHVARDGSWQEAPPESAAPSQRVTSRG